MSLNLTLGKNIAVVEEDVWTANLDLVRPYGEGDCRATTGGCLKAALPGQAAAPAGGDAQGVDQGRREEDATTDKLTLCQLKIGKAINAPVAMALMLRVFALLALFSSGVIKY